MEPSSSPAVRSSGIPRLSRLPLPQCFDKPISNSSTKSPAKSFVVPRSVGRNASIGAISAKPEQTTTVGAAIADVKPPNESHPAAERIQNHAAIAPPKARTLPRRPRPSLSDRTIETLSQVPPSPSPRRRRSSFLLQESPSKSASRPGSSMSRSRPGTSHGQHPPLPARPLSRPASPVKRHLAPTTGNTVPSCTPSRRSISSYVSKDSLHLTDLVSEHNEAPPPTARPSSRGNLSPVKGPSGNTLGKPMRKQLRGSKTLSARPVRIRPSIRDAFGSVPENPATIRSHQSSAKPKTSVATVPAKTSETALFVSPPSKTLTPAGSDLKSPKIPNSSAALRDTIAKAKAARQKANQAQGKGLKNDRHQMQGFPKIDVDDVAGVLRNRVASARTDGRLNIAALGLRTMPPEVMNMYGADLGDGAWYESVDLIRLVAADNDFEQFDETIFPDEAPGSHQEEDEYQGNLFGGLETLDLHGNQLKTVPTGLRRLERLTTLNVSKNSLGNDSISTICQIRSLRELRLAENAFSGTMSKDFCELKGLEVLDLHNNRISALPGDLQQLSHLRLLNVAGNQIQVLPFECLSVLPLVELDAARNRLSGELFPPDMQGLPNLKILDVANNAMTSITQNDSIHLPALQTFNVTENRLAVLPNVSSWTECITIIAGGNQLKSFPEGFTTLPRLRSADFSRNDIRRLDDRLGLMENLTVLRVANNPLRERRFLNLDADEIKRELKARLMSEDAADLEESEARNFASETPTVAAMGVTRAKNWSMKPGGILDRSSTRLETIASAELEPFVGTQDVKTLILSRNQLHEIPHTVNLLGPSLTKLDLSHNNIKGQSYLSSTLGLPCLKSLDLSSTTISSLSPILDNLTAPNLADLDISRNRLTSLVPLRHKFPSLISLLAADNKICILEVDVVRGLQVLDVSGNELMQLEPKLGLLGAEGLRTLIIGGNRFRVPRRDVIDKGTEAILSWLRGRIPDE